MKTEPIDWRILRIVKKLKKWLEYEKELEILKNWLSRDERRSRGEKGNSGKRNDSHERRFNLKKKKKKHRKELFYRLK